MANTQFTTSTRDHLDLLEGSLDDLGKGCPLLVYVQFKAWHLSSCLDQGKEAKTKRNTPLICFSDCFCLQLHPQENLRVY